MSNNQTEGLPRWKRTLDIILIILVLPLLIPLGLTIGLIIRLVSAGPMLFQQERVGFRGQLFLCLKFRTMHCGAEIIGHQGHLQELMQADVPMTKLDAKGDSRIIPIGKLLRATGLDELPQLFNVLKGEMSLVGPRPCLPYEAEKYLPWQKERFKAVPGLTGLWQVSGKNRTTFTKMIQLDIEYAAKKSLVLDLKIIFKTIPALAVQVIDTWQAKKFPSRKVNSERSMTARVVNP